MALMRGIEEEETLLGASAHVMAIGTKSIV